MKILLLTHRLQHPLHDGYNLHNHYYVRELHERHEFHLVSVGIGELPAEIAEQFASVTIVPPGEAPPSPSLVHRLVHALDVNEVHPFDPQLMAAAEKVVAEHDIDVCWTSGAKMLVYSARLGLPTLGDIADEALKEAVADLRRARTPGALLHSLRLYAQTKRYQRHFLRHAGVCTVVSEIDQATLSRHCPGLDTRVVPNGVDADVYLPLGTPPEHPSLVFEGAMNFVPNVEGIVSFCEESWPQIRAALPEAQLFIVGKNPTPQVSALAELPGVIVTGFVDDVRPWVDKASAFVCPLRRGAGIKNKILQAWAMEKAVIATPVSCGGLRIDPGLNIEVAEGSDGLTRACLELLGDADRRASLGAAGRATVMEHYTWASRAERMEAILEELVAARDVVLV